jgi:hypothetical protein
MQQQQQNPQGDASNGLNIPRESPQKEEQQTGGETVMRSLNLKIAKLSQFPITFS